MRVLGVVCARGGSKRLPGKNLRVVRGKPMMEWSVVAAKASKLDKVVVSTDMEEGLEIARRYGVEGIRRPKGLSGDEAKITDALVHALGVVGGEWTHVMLLQASSPMRTQADIDGALWIAEEEGSESVVTRYPDGKNTGCIYLVTVGMLKGKGVLWDEKTRWFEQSREMMVDVDTLEDFERAKKVMERG